MILIAPGIFFERFFFSSPRFVCIHRHGRHARIFIYLFNCYLQQMISIEKLNAKTIGMCKTFQSA